MEKAATNITQYIDRRLHPVRLSISHLNQILEGAKPGAMLSVNRDLLLSITSTLEIFLEDFEHQRGPASGVEAKGAEKPVDSPRVTQSRVS